MIQYNELVRGITSDYEDDTSNIKLQAVKQLSRCRYALVCNACYVKVKKKNKHIIVMFNNYTKIESILSYINELRMTDIRYEPSLDFMRSKLVSYEKNLIQFLRDYRKSFYLYGTNYNNKVWFKLYSDKPIEDPLRDYFGVKWIDYNKQLKYGNVIYDANKLCGLWAISNMETLKKCIGNAVCYERYGNKIMVLRPISYCRYLDDGKEIIGNKYRVIEIFDLIQEDEKRLFFERYLNE